MHRRQVLASCALGLTAAGGCLGLGADGAESRAPRRVAVEETFSELPEGLEPSVSVAERETSDERTAAVDITLRNTGSESYTLFAGTDFPFDTMGSDEETWLLLDDADPPKTSPDCWEPKPRSYAENDLGWTYDIEPGDEFSREFELWGSPRDDTCMPTGEVSFETSYHAEHRERSYSWGFRLSITAVESRA